MENEEELLRVNKERNILQTIKRMKADWFGYIFRRKCLLKKIIDEKIKGMGRRGRKRKQLLDDFKERRY